MEMRIPEEKLETISKSLVDALKQTSMYSRASLFLSDMAGSIPPRMGIPAKTLGFPEPQEAFEALKAVQDTFSAKFRKVLEESVMLQDKEPSPMSWDQLEVKVIPEVIDGSKIRIRFVMLWKTPSGVLALNSDTKWK